MSNGKEINFNYGKANANLPEYLKNFEFRNDDDNKLKNGLKNIFDAIKGLDGDSENFDSTRERDLLAKLQSIFSADKDVSISKAEMRWAQSFTGGDVVEFIQSKYDEVQNQIMQKDTPAVEGVDLYCNSEEYNDIQVDITLDGEAVTAYLNKQFFYYPGEASERPEFSARTAIGIIYADSEEDLEELQANIDAELQNIDNAHTNGDTAEILPALERIAQLVNNDLAIIDRIIDKYIADPEYVNNYQDLENSSLASFVDIRGYSFETDTAIGTLYATTIEGVRELREEFKAEFAKIKPAPEGDETPADESARKKQNMEAFAKITEMSGNDSDVVYNIINEYFNIDTEEYVDLKSPEYNAFVQKLMLSKDPQMISALTERLPDGGYRGNEETFRLEASIYREVIEKEMRGERLTEEEKQLKEMLSDRAIFYTYDFDVDSDGDGINDISMNIDGKGNICYIGEWGEFWNSDLGGTVTSTIAGKSRELVEEFQNDFRDIIKTLDEAPEYNEETEETYDELEARLFKELYAKYAETNDDSFACSVLTARFIKYADIEDIKKAIDSNGVEFLKYLHESGALEEFNDITQIAIYSSMANRISQIYKEAEEGNVINVAFLEDVYRIFSKCEELGIELDVTAEDMAKTYFDVQYDEDGEITSCTYEGRRLTEEEAEILVGSTNINGSMDIALLETMKPEDLAEGEWGSVMVKRATYYDLLERLGEMVDEIDGEWDIREFIENINNADIECNRETNRQVIPFDKIMEKFGDNEFVKDKLLQVCNKERNPEISEENRLKLIKDYLIEDGNIYKVDMGKLNDSSVSLKNLIMTLPASVDLNGDSDAAKVYRAIFEALPFGERYYDNTEAWVSFHNSAINGRSTDKFNQMFLEKLSGDVTVQNIQRASRLLDSMGVQVDDMHKQIDNFVEQVVDKLKHQSGDTDKELLKALIQFCGKYNADISSIASELSISDLSKNERKELQNVWFDNLGTAKEMEESKFSSAVDNGWFEKANEITSYRKNRTAYYSNELYLCGSRTIEVTENYTGKVKIKERSVEGTQAGLDIYDGVRGWNTRRGPQHRKAIAAVESLTKDSVVDAILTFNAASRDYNSNTTIMSHLNDERGISVATMLNVPNKLIEWAEANNKDAGKIQQLRRLVAECTNIDEHDLPRKGLAEEMDELMLEIINS